MKNDFLFDKQKWLKRLRFLCWSAVFIELLGLALLWRHHWLDRRLETRLDHLRQAGIRVTLEDFRKMAPNPAPADNAARCYLQAFNALSEQAADARFPPSLSSSSFDESSPLPPEKGQAIERHLARHAKAIQLLMDGARFSQCHYPATYIPATLFSAQPIEKGAGRARAILSLAARWNARHHRPAEVIADLEASLALAASAANDPSLSADTQYICGILTVFGDLRWALLSCPFEEQDFRRIVALLQQLEHHLHPTPQMFCRALALGELYGACSARNLADLNQDCLCDRPKAWHPLRDRPPNWIVTAGAFVYQIAGNHKADLDRHWETAEKLGRAMSKPLPQRMDSARKVLEEAATIQGRFYPSALFDNLYEVILRMDSVLSALHAIDTTAVAVERYRLQSKKLPESLASLTPRFLTAIPLDPYDGQPLRYRRVGNHYRIWSVGLDRRDDGGVIPPEKHASDVIFTTEPPPPKPPARQRSARRT